MLQFYIGFCLFLFRNTQSNSTGPYPCPALDFFSGGRINKTAVFLSKSCGEARSIVNCSPLQTAITIMKKLSQDAHTMLDCHLSHYCCYFPLFNHSLCRKRTKIAV